MMKQKGLLLYQRKQLHPSLWSSLKLDKKKRPPRVEANIEGSNVKDNELPLSRLFGVHFTLWQKFSESRGHESKSVERIVQ